MSENITLEQLYTAQNEYIAAQSAKINSLEANTSSALAALSELANRVYSYNHEAVVTDSLETVYDSIIEENPELTELSAAGFTAVISSGSTIPTQDNLLFINGTQEETDYTYSGENSDGGIELVRVWYFENNGALTLDRVNADITGISVKVKETVPEFSADFFDYADSVAVNMNITAMPVGVKKQKNISGGAMSDLVSSVVSEYENYCTSYPKKANLYGHTNLKKASFPYLVTIYGGDGAIRTFLNGCTNCENISFPVLQEILDSNGGYGSPFNGVPYIVVPESVKSIGKSAFINNKSVLLFCRDAQTIHDSWCENAPTELFSLCDDWGTSINISVAAARWTKEQFIDLFQNRLRDMDDDVREIKIPTAIYDDLTDDEFAIAEDAGWTVGA